MLTNKNTAVSFPTKEIIYLDVNSIRVNPNQPRKFFSSDAIIELASSIIEHGILVPLSIRYTKGTYELIAGERRLRASKEAGLTTVPCIIVDVDTEQSQVLAIIENLQRENLNYIEEAEAFHSLLKEHGYTQEVLAQKICKNQSTIANKLRLLKLEPKIKEILIDNNLTERHARALLKIKDENVQLEVLDKVINSSLNVSKTENLIDNYINNKDKTISFKDKIKNQQFKMVIKDVKIFIKQIKGSVDMLKKGGVNANYQLDESENEYKITVTISK